MAGAAQVLSSSRHPGPSNRIINDGGMSHERKHQSGFGILCLCDVCLFRRSVTAMETYSKKKERSPEETVFRIRQILHEAGVYPVLKWLPEEYSGIRSNRLYLDSVYSLGTNGKGTDERYAEASAFAEMMERIQNNLLQSRNFDPDTSPYPSVALFPDERDMSIAELLAQKDSFLAYVYEALGFDTALQQSIFLRMMAKQLYGRDDGILPSIPFAEPEGSRVVWIPAGILIFFCGSNGMSAGNSMEEALVQGFSEILERHVQSRILRERLTPPEIPAEELEKYSLGPLIRDIEASGRYRVSVRDCSLGDEGLPVSAVVIADRENGTFGVKFGCHPSFPVSVERTLTEALQGKRVRIFTAMNAIGTPEQVDSYDNYPNTTKTGEGFYPAAFLGAAPSWRYRPWTQWESADNREYLKKLLALFRRMGCAPLFRDASHLGFPTYWIVIPGVSELFDVSRLRLREGSSTVNSRRAFRHFPRLTPPEEENLFRLILFKERSTLENSLCNISGLYLKGDLLTADRVGACLALKHGRYPDAARLFRRAAEACREGKEQHYLRCLSEYARLLHAEASREDALSALTLLFGEEAARRAEFETADPDAMPEKMFPQLTCYDCARCPAAGIHCEYPAVKEILKKLNRAMERSTVSQEALLESLKTLTETRKDEQEGS